MSSTEFYTVSNTDLDTRSRILIETLRLMEKQGGKGVRVQDVAEAAGVTRQTVYLHFGSRAGLLIAALRYLDEVYDANSRACAFLNAETGEQAIDMYVAFWGSYMPQLYGLVKNFMTLLDSDPDAAIAWKDRMSALEQGCDCIIRQLESEGKLAENWNDRAEAVDFIMSMLSFRLWEELTIVRGWSTERYVGKMQATLKRIFIRFTVSG